MDPSENPIAKEEAEVIKVVEEVKKDATEKGSEFVKDMKQSAKSLFGNVKESASHVGGKVENKVEKLVSDQWTSIKNFGGLRSKDKKTVPDQESGSKSTTDQEATLPTSDKNVEEESSENQKITTVEESCEQPENAEVDENPRSSETQPFVAVSGGTRASWMNCCGLLDVLKRSDD